MFVYRFDDYWKDVGTVESLWDANLDLLNPNIDLNLADPNWKIYSKNRGLPPQYISVDAKIENSLISEGCEVCGNVDFSILFSGVTVAKDANVLYSLIMPGAKIESGATVKYAIIAENAVIKSGAVVGESPEECKELDNWGIAVIGDGLTVGKNATVSAKKMVTEDVKEGEAL